MHEEIQPPARPAHPYCNGSPLSRSQLEVNIMDLVAEYELHHFFQNPGREAIEALFSFPVPIESAFMGMRASLAGATLVAEVLPKERASNDYDDALADGDSAVLLEYLEPGMLCVNLGNLKPGEEGEIVLRFAAPLRTADRTARFSLPLVHRPRYGESRLGELHQPMHDFAIEHPLDAIIKVRGLLTEVPVNCATHSARFSAEGDAQVLHLNEAMLDRDLVVVFDLPEDLAPQGKLVRDGDGLIGVLNLTAPPRQGLDTPFDLCLLLDGSGSMSGDAIRQSRAALYAIAGALNENDRVQVLRFGSTIVPLFRRPLKASERVREAMIALADTVAPDLGGTEMGKALEHSINTLTGLYQQSDRNCAIILVTDGAVHPHEIEIAQSRAIGEAIRIFVVAVGSSAGADVLAPLARKTMAALERAVPAEPIDECVMRQLRRAREPGPLQVWVDWGSQDARPLPLEAVYPGDAITAVAMLPNELEFEVRVDLSGNVDAFSLTLAGSEDLPALRAIVGHQAWQFAPVNERQSLALRYGLITDETSAVLVKERAEDDKAEGLPRIASVTHMVPYGMVAHAMRMPVLDHLTGHAQLCDQSPDVMDYYNPSFCRFLDKEGKPKSNAGKALPNERIAEICSALRDALEELLLGDHPNEFGIRGLMDLIDPALHVDVRKFLRTFSIKLEDPKDAYQLLNDLVGRGIGPPLTDDQEAMMSVWRAKTNLYCVDPD